MKHGLILLLAVVCLAAPVPGQQEETPTMSMDGSSALPDRTKPGYVTGQATLTVRELKETPAKYASAGTQLVEGVAVSDAVRLDTDTKLPGVYTMTVREPSTRAYVFQTSTLGSGEVAFCFINDKMANYIRDNPKMEHVAARLRFRVEPIALKYGRVGYAAIVSSIEWMDNDGNVVMSLY